MKHAQPEAVEHFLHGGRLVVGQRRGAVPISIGKGIAAWTFEHAQLVEIAGERGLGYLEAAAAQLAPQLILVGHPGVRYKVANRVVPQVLHGRRSLSRQIESAAGSARPRLHKYTTEMNNYATGSGGFSRKGSVPWRGSARL